MHETSCYVEREQRKTVKRKVKARMAHILVDSNVVTFCLKLV